ncbi:MAG: hypothetical protein ACOY0T_38790 [Myxococcota bacterium]
MPDSGLHFWDIGSGGEEVWAMAGPNAWVYRWNGNGWTRKSTLATSEIEVSPEGRPWIVDMDLGVYRWNGVAFVRVGDLCAQDIAVGANDDAWAVGCDEDGMWNRSIFRWNPSTRVWQQIPGRANSVGMSGSGRAWIYRIFSDRDVAYERVGSSWIWRGGATTRINFIEGASMTEYPGSTDVYGWNPNTQSFQLYLASNMHLNDITWGPGPLWGVDTDGRVYKAETIR